MPITKTTGASIAGWESSNSATLIEVVSLVKQRCPWCPSEDALYVVYHDEEWGVPVRDGQKLFEMLNLEGAQAGLSWRTVLGAAKNGFHLCRLDNLLRLHAGRRHGERPRGNVFPQRTRQVFGSNVAPLIIRQNSFLVAF